MPAIIPKIPIIKGAKTTPTVNVPANPAEARARSSMRLPPTRPTRHNRIFNTCPPQLRVGTEGSAAVGVSVPQSGSDEPFKFTVTFDRPASYDDDPEDDLDVDANEAAL